MSVYLFHRIWKVYIVFVMGCFLGRWELFDGLVYNNPTEIMRPLRPCDYLPHYLCLIGMALEEVNQMIL